MKIIILTTLLSIGQFSFAGELGTERKVNLENAAEVQDTIALIKEAASFHINTEKKQKKCGENATTCLDEIKEELISNLAGLEKNLSESDAGLKMLEVMGKEEGGWNFEDDVLGTTVLILDFTKIALIQRLKDDKCKNNVSGCIAEVFEQINSLIQEIK